MAKPEKTAVKKKNRIRVNFDGVETRAHIPDGEYHAKVHEISVEEGQQYQYLKWTFELMEEKLAGRKLYYNTSLAPQALWNLRNLLETLGVETPDKEVDLDLDSYKDLELMVRVEGEVYEGKERPKVTDFKPLEETASASETEDGEEEGEDDGEEGAEDGETEDEGEEEAKMTPAEVREMDEKELADLVKLHSLPVKLDKLPKLSKKIAAVVDAMEAKDLLASE